MLLRLKLVARITLALVFIAKLKFFLEARLGKPVVQKRPRDASPRFYLVTIEELERLLPSMRDCGWEIYGAMSYQRWIHHPSRTSAHATADLVVFPPFLTDELNWPIYGGGNWDNNYARSGNNPGSVGNKAGHCSLEIENFIRTKYELLPHQKYLLHMGSCGWDRGYALPSEAYRDKRAIIAKGNALNGFHRPGIDISMPPPFTDNPIRMRSLSSNTDRSILLGFKGSLETHPIRETIRQALHDPNRGMLILNKDDREYDYWELLSKSIFALVIRGHVSFSYRFSEVVCSGAIPVLVSDDWIPPFDDIVPFQSYGVRLPESQINDLPTMLGQIDKANRVEMSFRAVSFCQNHIITPWHQFDTLITIALSRSTGVSSSQPFIESNGHRLSPTQESVSIVSWLPSSMDTPGYRLLAENRRRYCKKHGYNFLEFNEETLPTQHLRDNWRELKHMVKPHLLLYLLSKTHGWIVWMDADTLFTNFHIKWERFLVGDVVYSDSPDVVSNNGVFALKTGFVSRSFVIDWIERSAGMSGAQDNISFIFSLLHFSLLVLGELESTPCEGLNDYSTLSKCFFETLKTARAHAPCKVTDGQFTAVSGINSGLNFQEPNKFKDGDFILHFAGTSAEVREGLALKYADMYSKEV